MLLYIVRHGETDWNKEKKLQGQSDTELNAYGIELAKKTAEGLKDVRFDYVYSSPLKRAKATAEILCEGRNTDILTDDRLKEICFGENEGVPANDLGPDFHYFFDKPEIYVPAKGGETYEELCKRTSEFFNEVIVPLSEREPEANVLITAHGAVNKSLIIYLKHLGIEDMWSGEFQKNCCVNIFEVFGNEFRLIEEAKVFY